MNSRLLAVIDPREVDATNLCMQDIGILEEREDKTPGPALMQIEKKQQNRMSIATSCRLVYVHRSSMLDVRTRQYPSQEDIVDESTAISRLTF